MDFHCIVMSPDERVFDGHVNQVILPAHDGLMGILSNRAPIIVKLGTGPLQIDDATTQKPNFYVIDGGLAQMRQNTLTILTSNITRASEIDHQAAVEDFNKALNLPAKTPSEIEEREKAVNLARAKRAMSERH